MTAPRPRVALTLGDPAGVGPELAARLLAAPGRCATRRLLLADAARWRTPPPRRAGVGVPLAATVATEAALLDDGSAPRRDRLGVVSRAAGQRACTSCAARWRCQGRQWTPSSTRR